MSAESDPWVCPECRSTLPEKYRTLAVVECPTCWRQVCHTNVFVLPVAGEGHVPARIQTASAYWQPAPPSVVENSLANRANCQVAEARERYETALKANGLEFGQPIAGSDPRKAKADALREQFQAELQAIHAEYCPEKTDGQDPISALKIRCRQEYVVLDLLECRPNCDYSHGIREIYNRARELAGSPTWPEEPAQITTVNEARRAVDGVLRWLEDLFPSNAHSDNPRTSVPCLDFPLASTGPLPPELLAAFNAAVYCATLADGIGRLCQSVQTEKVTGLITLCVETLTAKHNDCRAAILAVTNELTAVRDSPASFGDIQEPNAHLAAMTLTGRVLREVWQAVDPEGWAECLLDPAKRMNPLWIARQFSAVSEHFRTIQLPAGKSIIAACQMEAAKAALARIRPNREIPLVAPDASSAPAPSVKRKRSTVRGEGRTKLIAALTKHHQYADGGYLNLEPIGNNELARQAQVSESTASAFFNDKFEGHTKYKALCRDSGGLLAALKLLNNEFAPHNLYGRRPGDEEHRGDDK